MFGSGRPGTFGSCTAGSCGLGRDAIGSDGLGRVTGSFGNWTGPTFGSWIPDPDPLDPLPPERIFVTVPAAAASGLWTAEPAVPVTVLAADPDPDGFVVEAGAAPPADPPAEPAAEVVCVEEEPEAEPPPDPTPGPEDLAERSL